MNNYKKTDVVIVGENPGSKYDKAIEYRLSNKKLETKSEEFNIFSSKKSEDNFLKYVEEFDKYENSTAKDQDIIETDEGEW